MRYLLVGFFIFTGCATYRGATYRAPKLQLPGEPAPLVERQGLKPTLLWPVENARMTQGFNGNSGNGHQGLDLAAPLGTPVFAAHEGRVVYSGRSFRGYGRMILIEYDHQWATLYGHLKKITVKQGQIVRQGDKVGLMGRSGRATGVHLHFELMENKIPVDPTPYLPSQALALTRQQ